MDILILFLMFFGAPTACIVFFIVSLIMFIVGKVKNKKIPNSVEPNKMLVRKTCLIVSSVMLAIFIAIFVTVIILFSTVVSFM